MTTKLVRAFHVGLLGTQPTDVHLSLYRAHVEWSAAGFDDGSLDEEKFVAILVLALWYAKKNKVLIATTRPYERQVIELLRVWCTTIFRRFRGHKAAAQAFGRSYKRLVLSSHSTLRVPEPKHWVSFGLSSSDALPGWVREKLL